MFGVSSVIYRITCVEFCRLAYVEEVRELLFDFIWLVHFCGNFLALLCVYRKLLVSLSRGL